MPTFSASSIVPSLLASALLFCADACAPAQSPPPSYASGEGAPPATSAPATPSTTASAPSAATGAASPASTPPMIASPIPRPPPGTQIYRLDFVLASKEGPATPANTAFTLILNEGHKGEVLVGKNVPLTPAPANPSGPLVGSPRQDVGLKVVAQFRVMGDDLLLEVQTEMSTFEPPTTIRKVVSQGDALAAVGKSSLVTSLDEDKKHYQLTVTATRLR
jgi:hypothetical protein